MFAVKTLSIIVPFLVGTRHFWAVGTPSWTPPGAADPALCATTLTRPLRRNFGLPSSPSWYHSQWWYILRLFGQKVAAESASIASAAAWNRGAHSAWQRKTSCTCQREDVSRKMAVGNASPPRLFSGYVSPRLRPILQVKRTNAHPLSFSKGAEHGSDSTYQRAKLHACVKRHRATPNALGKNYWGGDYIERM